MEASDALILLALGRSLVTRLAYASAAVGWSSAILGEITTGPAAPSVAAIWAPGASKLEMAVELNAPCAVVRSAVTPLGLNSLGPCSWEQAVSPATSRTAVARVDLAECGTRIDNLSVLGGAG